MHEALLGPRSVEAAGADRLDRDLTVHAGLLAEEHLAHATATESADDLELPEALRLRSLRVGIQGIRTVPNGEGQQASDRFQGDRVAREEA